LITEPETLFMKITPSSTDGRRGTDPADGAEPAINRSDRDALLKYDRSRTRARKEDAEAYGAHLIAQFEEQLAREFAFDEDATWKAAHEDAIAAVEAARRAIAERCEQRGIPKWARPNLSVGWWERGENASKRRREELRKVAQSRAAALVKAAKARIERDSVEFQGQLLAGALSTSAAKALLDGLPSIESLMPPLDLAEFKLLRNGGNSAPEEDNL
jgi:hypothetical protein